MATHDNSSLVGVVKSFLIFTCLIMSVGAINPVGFHRVCQAGTKLFYNQVINDEVCCIDILCKRGMQPMPCDGTSTIPTCLLCPEHTYQRLRKRLSDDRSIRNCRAKTNCDFYLDKGTTTKNAKCGCPPDKFDSGDGICLPRPECPPGEGQTMMGSCERCSEGETFSDKASFTEPCKPVTNCEARRSKCILKKATIYSDNECGRRYDRLQPCKNTVLTEKTSTPTTISTQHEVNPPPPLQSSSGGLLVDVLTPLYYIIMIMGTIIVPVIDIIRFVYLLVLYSRESSTRQFVDNFRLTFKQFFKTTTDKDPNRIKECIVEVDAIPSSNSI